MIKISETKGGDWLKQTSILSQALPFMQRYAGKNITIKYGGSAMGKDKLSSSFSRDIVLLKQVGINPIVIHGGGPRIKKMLENGWINEVKSLLDSGIKIDSAPMRSIGYREVAEYIKNNLSKDELEEKIYTSTRKLMRHQDNWFKKSDKRIKWINFSNSFSEADIIIKESLEN